MKIDLGCGQNKVEGFIGVDRFALTGVDVIADLDQNLPFENDTVDLAFASHSLEHVRDLMATMREIYRVCKHGAQVCIVAPYNEQKLNLANPYHISVFNEHTPRFWTNYPESSLDPDEYSNPHAEGWGLSLSDHSDPGLDIRLVRMEFFYFAPYRYLPIDYQRRLRRERIDVCDQIMYHLIVWKGDTCPDSSYKDYVDSFQPFEPNHILERKQRECREFDKMCISYGFEGKSPYTDLDPLLLFSKIEKLYSELSSTNAALSVAQNERNRLSEALSELKAENVRLAAQVEATELLKAKMIPLRAELEAVNGLLVWQRAKEDSWSSELSRMNAELAVARQGSGNWIQARRIVDNLFAQLCGYRSSRWARWLSILSGEDALWNSVSPAFRQIKTYTAEKFRHSSRMRLVLGEDLRATPFREYRIPFPVSRLNSVSLAITPLLPTAQGSVGVEIVSAEDQVVAQVTLPASAVTSEVPTDFTFSAPLESLAGNWALRAFVRDIDVPVALYELVNCMSIRRTAKCSPFVSLC